MLNNKDIFCTPVDAIRLEVITKAPFSDKLPNIINVKSTANQKQTVANVVNVVFLRIYQHHMSHNEEISSTARVMMCSCSVTVRYLTLTIFWKRGVNILYRWIWPWSHFSSCTQFKKVMGATGQTLDLYTRQTPYKRNIYCYFLTENFNDRVNLIFQRNEKAFTILRELLP